MAAQDAVIDGVTYHPAYAMLIEVDEPSYTPHTTHCVEAYSLAGGDVAVLPSGGSIDFPQSAITEASDGEFTYMIVYRSDISSTAKTLFYGSSSDAFKPEFGITEVYLRQGYVDFLKLLSLTSTSYRDTNIRYIEVMKDVKMKGNDLTYNAHMMGYMYALEQVSIDFSGFVGSTLYLGYSYRSTETFLDRDYSLRKVDIRNIPKTVRKVSFYSQWINSSNPHCDFDVSALFESCKRAEFGIADAVDYAFDLSANTDVVTLPASTFINSYICLCLKGCSKVDMSRASMPNGLKMYRLGGDGGNRSVKELIFPGTLHKLAYGSSTQSMVSEMYSLRELEIPASLTCLVYPGYIFKDGYVRYFKLPDEFDIDGMNITPRSGIMFDLKFINELPTKLADHSTDGETRTIIIGAGNLARMTDAQVAEINRKGRTIA